MKNMKNFACILVLLIISATAFSQTQIGTNQIRNESITESKLAPNALRPITSGVLSGTELTFDEVHKKYTLTVDSDIALTVAASGNLVDSRIYLTATGDGSHVLSFPSDWKPKNSNVYDPAKVNDIEINYRGTHTTYEIINLAPVILPVLLTAVVVGDTDDITLIFDTPVTITTAGWTYTASGGAVTVSSVVSGSGTSTIVLDLSRNITAGENMTTSYNPTTGATISATGNELAIITDRFVDTGNPPPSAFCDITACPTGGDYTTGQAASDAAVSGQTVCFCSGTFRETIVGKTGVKYRNVPGEVAIISGLELAGTTGWTVHSGNIYKKTITLPVAGNISGGDLTSNTTLVANQIFKGSDMVMLASWPKRSIPEDMLDRLKFRDLDNASSVTASQIVDAGLPSTGNLSGAYINILGWFYTQTRTVTRSGNTLTFPATVADLHFSKFYYLTNHIDLLTQANEWHYTGGILYVWQNGGGSPTGIEYKARNWGFDLRGKTDVTIEGLHFIGCEPMTGNTSSNNIVIDNIRATYTNHAFTQQGFDHIYRSPLMNGMKMIGSNCVVKNSEFKYCASQLIWAGPNCLVQNNLASDISYEGNYGAFVTPYLSAGGIRVMYNTVSRVGRSVIDFGYDGPDQGGAVYGGTHQHLNLEVGYNIFNNYLMLNVDGGATYGARGIDLTGLVIHHNWIYNNAVGDKWNTPGAAIPPEDWYGAHAGIYFDQGAGPATVHHNVLWDGSTLDLFMQPLYGRITKWYNNTLASDMPRTKWTYATWYTVPGDIMRNNIAVGYININHGAGLGDLRNNLLSTENSNNSANNTINNSPVFVGPTTVGVTNGENFAIQTSSPAKDIGVAIAGITDGYVGAAPDAGAYEFGATNWIPGYVAGAGENEPYIIDGPDMTFPVGAWTHASGQTYTLSPTFTISYSSTANAEVENLSFSGTEIKLYSEKFNTHGIVEVKIDGVRVDCDPGTGGIQDCDLYEATTVNNSQLIGTWTVAPGTHTYEQKLVGQNPSGTAPALNMIDYLLVTP